MDCQSPIKGDTVDMAPLIHMPEPLCLIENTNGPLLVNPEALKILSAIRQPVVVVAIVGLYRTGKSYLMNKLAGKNKGFSVGSTVQSHTKGIWMWCVPHPKKPNHTLVLLDTEGLGDVEKKFFPVKKCFIFDLPTHQKKLAQLETLHNDDLDPKFVQQVAEFCSYIFSHSKTKTLSGGIKASGSHLENLVQTYVNAINSGDLPCMESEVLTLAQIKNSVAVQKAIAHYDQEMGQKLQLPAETLQELLYLHRASEKKAIEVFMKNSFKDEDQGYQKKLEMQLAAKQNDFHKRNLEASQNRCSALLEDIFHPLEENVKQGVYSKPGGHRLFIQQRDELKAKYNQEPRKGIQAEEALQKYLESKESMSVTILQTDLALTAMEKEIEGITEEFIKAEAQRLMESLMQHQQMMESRKIFHQEQVRLMETNRVYQEALQQRVMECQLQVLIKKRLKSSRRNCKLRTENFMMNSRIFQGMTHQMIHASYSKELKH
ncbi:guanylate-binding protein 5 isoform X6 [Bubalus bubalis]|uniref:guanylate-binding protein 5 isoform X6 n=1 Tax=Bubalus bubalis TaxID=89462 RepID=UPI001D10466C|nr:guanylate-binding protein 5 isoform X6 [Bubalus bubalis]